MREFAAYVERLANLVEKSSDGRRPLPSTQIASALDGEPSRILRQSLSVSDQRQDGIFFTGSKLAQQVAAGLAGQLSASSVVTDPTCGGGDLLLACSKFLPKAAGLFETLELWSECLRGQDLHQEFISSTKFRLVLNALELGVGRKRITRDQVSSYFPGIRKGNTLSIATHLKESTHVVTNPPYTMVPAPPQCEWGSGLVNAAAMFLDVTTEQMEPGTQLLAILPDVLRCGSRYASWRRVLNSRLANISTSLLGRFSKHADVDVFLLKARKRNSVLKAKQSSSTLFRLPQSSSGSVGDKFDVHVGPVVPHRDKKTGKRVPLLAPHNCPSWATCTEFTEFRRFAGRTFRPPFVVIRRTSRSNDKFRAVGSLIQGKVNIAVENHLIVLVPKSGTKKDCELLLKILRSDQTNDWLNRRMCCRHLTVSAVSSIPWSSASL